MTKYKVEFELESGLVPEAIKRSIEIMMTQAENVSVGEVEE